jgi:hypothetical protein
VLTRFDGKTLEVACQDLGQWCGCFHAQCRPGRGSGDHHFDPTDVAAPKTHTHAHGVDVFTLRRQRLDRGRDVAIRISLWAGHRRDTRRGTYLFTNH